MKRILIILGIVACGVAADLLLRELEIVDAVESLEQDYEELTALWPE